MVNSKFILTCLVCMLFTGCTMPEKPVVENPAPAERLRIAAWSIEHKGMCLTPPEAIGVAISVAIGITPDRPPEVVSQLTGYTAFKFVNIHRKIFERSPQSVTTLVADEVLVFGRESEPDDTFVMLYRKGCLIQRSLLRNNLFNTIMQALGSEDHEISQSLIPTPR